jgi:hypothetical protein
MPSRAINQSNVMSPKSHEPEDELQAYILGVATACPLEQCNPEDCPLFELRRLEPGVRMAWLKTLEESDLEYLASYHFVCLNLKVEKRLVGPGAM